MRLDSSVLASLAVVVVTMIAGCGGVEDAPGPPARPVTYLVLNEVNPVRLTRLTGSVESWKKEMLAFRVPGRVAKVVEPGIDIAGDVKNDNGETVSPGTLLASLMTDRYVLRKDEAVARLNVTKARMEQARTELERAIPERIKAATADRENKSNEFRREEELLARGAASRSEFELAENEFKQAEAVLAQAQAEQATKTAELAALNAETKEAEQLLRQAETDLSDCQLYSPFTGQISKVHAIAGSYLELGMPVVTVQMMDPVKVEIAVSQQTESQVRFNETVDIYLAGSDTPIPGVVYLKDTVADAATRTFSITILVRNRRIQVGLPPEEAEKELVSTTDLFGLEAENADGRPPFFAEQSSIHTDADGNAFVWQAEELTLDDLRGDFKPVFKVKKVPVSLGEKMLSVLQVYRYRELTDYGSLDPLQSVVTGKLPEGVQDGDQVFLARNEWLLRPGQLVQVQFQGRSPEPGFYVPRPAILLADGKHYVFVVDEADAGIEQARRVEVQVGALVNDYRRIEAREEGQLGSGTKVILDGAHYLRNGDQVNAFDEIEVAL